MATYQFKNTPLVFNASMPGMLGTPSRKAPPPIGPDIGPDPRNSQCSVSIAERPVFEGEHGIRYDFAYGFRVLLPKCDDMFQVRVYDMRSGSMLSAHDVKGGSMLVGERKFFIPYHIEVHKKKEDGSCELLWSHDYDCKGRKVYVVVPDGGLGDNLAWLPIVEEFRKLKQADVTCVMGEWMIRWLGRDMYPGLKFLPIGEKPSLRDAYACYFCGIFSEEKKPWRPIDHQNLGMQRAVEAILDVPFQDIKCRMRLGSPRPFPEPFVVISAMATNPAKYWNFPDGWNTIVRWLKGFGYRVLCIDRDHDLYFAGRHFQVPSEAEDLTGFKPISERMRLMEHADFFIGLPSGLSWLAWNCGVPVVMLAGFTLDGSEFPTPYRVTNFLFCHGCWNDSREFFDPKAPVWCPRHAGTQREIECTRAITPKMVMETIERIPAFQARVAAKETQGPAYFTHPNIGYAPVVKKKA